MAIKKISGREFQVGAVLATDALRLQFRLLRIIGGGVDRLPTILAGVGQAEGSEVKEKSNAAAVAAIADMIAKADPEDAVKLMGDIAGMAQIKQPSGSWGTVDLDQDFTERKGDLFPLLAFVLREVLGDFFAGLQGAGALSKLVGRA